MQAIASAADGGLRISNLEWTFHSRPYFGLRFYHFLLPLFCRPCVSTCGQLQEPPDCLLRLIPPILNSHANNIFCIFCGKSCSFPCSCYVFSLLQTSAHQYTHIALLQDTLGSHHNGLNIQGCACWPAVQISPAFSRNHALRIAQHL